MATRAKIVRHSGLLSNTDFTITANQIGYESEIATYIVPQNKVLELPDKFIGMRLMTKETFTFSTGTGETTHACTLTYPIASNELLSLVGKSVIVVKSGTPNAEWTNFTVTLPNTVTISGLTQSTNYTFYIFYHFCDGSVNITVTSDDGNVKTKVLEKSIREINQINTEDVRKGLKYGMVGLIIPERYKIQVKVITSAPIVLYYPNVDTGAKSKWARESFIELPVDVSDILQWPEGIKAFAKQQFSVA
jgi:hypothetical protein